MMSNKQKLVISLLKRVRQTSVRGAIEQMWEVDLLDKKALERLYIATEVERRVRAGEGKTNAIRQLAAELDCSYEKVRNIVYKKQN